MTKNLLLGKSKKARKLFRMIIPAHPFQNVFSAVADKMTSLGPIMVATSVSKFFWDFDVEVIDENNYRGPRDQDDFPDHTALQQRPADVVGFYCGLTSTMPRVYELAKFYQAEKAVTIAGGDHVCQQPAEALQNNIDIVVRGEGEMAIRRIIKAVVYGEAELKDVSGISWQLDGQYFHNPPEKIEIEDLNYLPRPDFGLLRWAKKIIFYPISRTRGCSKHCEFCAVRGQPRWSTAEHLLEDILWLTQTRQARYFFITDDRLNEDLAGTKRLFELIVKAKDEGILARQANFIIQIRLEVVHDQAFLKLMRQAGVFMMCIGYESPIAAELNAMKKGTKPEEMAEATKIFKKQGFWVHAMFIFGYPGKQTGVVMSAEQRVQEFKKFIRQARPDTIQVMLATPIFGTELYARLAEQGRIYPRDILGWENYDGGHLVFQPDPPLTALEVQQSIIKITRWFYSGWSFWRVPLLILSFPFIVPFSFRRWQRWWRNTLWGCIGHRLIVKWTKIHKQNHFLQRLTMAKERLFIR